MSLKAFHIVFVTVSLLFAVGFGLWGILEYQQTHDSRTLWLAVGSLVVAIALLWYGRWFLKKLKNVDYL